ncbi:MAG TPA: DUF2225 domain-containing protein [Epulopiscium sp.]|nr:DUF2225 domain-containing protein [Candidatus Epulonipiscium sp.]
MSSTVSRKEQLGVLYDKTYECPVCNNTFTSKGIRSGKNKVISTDSDLYSKFDIVNPVLYDVVICDCGYAALAKVFEELRPTQIAWIREEITSKYQKIHYPVILNPENAINRYKLALLNATVKKSRIGERAYICLKIGWLYRDLGDKDNERLFLEHARKDFLEAFTSERFPIFELDELTTTYLIAELSRKAGDFETASRWAGDLITKTGVPERLKNRARDLRESIKKD